MDSAAAEYAEADKHEMVIPDFRRWLSSTYAWDATETEVQAMSRRYAVPGKRGYISVAKFLQALNTGTKRTEDDQRRKEKIGASTIVVPDTSQLPKSLQSSRWTLEKIEAKIRSKISERTKLDRFQNLFLLFCDERVVKETHTSTITKEKFVSSLKNKLQILLSEEEADALFARWDMNGDGTIDVREFAKALMPKDIDENKVKYIGAACHDYSKAISKVYSKPPAAHKYEDLFVNTAPRNLLSDLTIPEIKALIRNKLEERMNIEGNCFQYQKIFRILSEGRNCNGEGMPKDMLRQKLLTKFSIKLPEEDFSRLFDEFDKNKNGKIELNEFISGIFLEDFAKDGSGSTAIWNSSTSESFDLRPGRPAITLGVHADEDTVDSPSSSEPLPHLMRRLDALNTRIHEILNENASADPGGNSHAHPVEFFHALLGGKRGEEPQRNMPGASLAHQLQLHLGLRLTRADVHALTSCFQGDAPGTVDAAAFLDYVRTGPVAKAGTAGSQHSTDEAVPLEKSSPPRPPKLAIRRGKNVATAKPPGRSASHGVNGRGEIEGQERALSSAVLSAEEIADKIREQLVAKSQVRGGSHFLFKQIYRIVRAGVKASNNSVGMITAEGFRQVFAKEAGIHMSQREVETLWRKYDTERRGVLHIASLAKKFLPVDSDGSHHLTPLSEEARTRSGTVRNHLFSIMGKANAQASLVGTLQRAEYSNAFQQQPSSAAGSGLSAPRIPPPVVGPDPRATSGQPGSTQSHNALHTMGPAQLHSHDGARGEDFDNRTHASEFSQFVAMQQASLHGKDKVDGSGASAGHSGSIGVDPRRVEAAIETARRRRLGAKDPLHSSATVGDAATVASVATTGSTTAAPNRIRRPSSASMRSSRQSPRAARHSQNVSRSPSTSFGLQGSSAQSRLRPQSAGATRPRSAGVGERRPGSKGAYTTTQSKLDATRRIVYSPIKYDGRFVDRANS